MTTARKFVLAVAVAAALLTIAGGWLMLSLGACEYRLLTARVSPTDRYVAEIYSADCGMSAYYHLLLLRDRSALALPNLDGRPAGTVISREVSGPDRGGDVVWDTETHLLVLHAGRAPQLLRDEWGGVQIETRRVD